MEISGQGYELFKDVLSNLLPPPDITISEWADRYRYLSSKSAAEPGRWKTNRAPYQREPMDAFSDEHVKKVVLMWGAQMGKTDSVILNPLGYHAKEDPCPIRVRLQGFPTTTAILHFFSALGTVYQTGKGICCADVVCPSHCLTELLHQLPGFFIHNRFLRVFCDIPLRWVCPNAAFRFV